MKRFIIHTFGCQMNVCDSERISDILCAAGWESAASDDEADLVVFNTCCVRGSAEERAFGRLTLMKHWRRKKSDRILALCGCIAQKDGQALLSRFPFLDLVVGTRDFHLFPVLIDEVVEKKSREAFISHIDQCVPEIESPRRSKGFSAFVTIMYGCDNFCSYCIVPFVRGREVSRSKEDVCMEVDSLVKMGVKEVCLLGQNVNSYKDPTTGADFPDLLKLVDSIPGIERIRFTTSHPKDASDNSFTFPHNPDRIPH
jgi:tRNA-2-methylthio-N6-dimethylallyladenosine synthase